ncbi:MAG TPA: NIPSNAP family protein, partial [Candidatus Acidoferrum sp.]|nr:NIPSNAP family protein [Candidatus Acidoferrum sp.]
MIYEIRTYRVKVGSLPEVEKRFGEGYEYRKKISPLAAFWHTEIGPLNEIIHVWPYADLGERNRLRAEAVKAGNWPPKIAEFIETMQSEIVVPFAFLPDLKPGKMGPYFEMRYYAMKAGTLPDLVKRWESKIEERMKMSPVALAGHVEHGEANRFIHIWAYKSLDER